MIGVDDYLNRITSEHNQKPDYLATVTLTLQPFVEVANAIAELPNDFDLDYAIGAQLDAVGVRVGRDRYIAQPLNIYFSLNVAGLGLNEGVLRTPFDPLTGLTSLPDDVYRTVLRAKVLANQWNGTVPGAYAAWDVLFPPDGDSSVLVADHGANSLIIALVGNTPSTLTLALFSDGRLQADLTPATCTTYSVVPSVYPGGVPGGTPLFGLNVDNDAISGLNKGALATTLRTD